MNYDTIKKAIEHYGENSQIIICIEEMSELIQALTKSLRGIPQADHLTEEIADVEITLEYVKRIYGITEENIELVKRAKLERLERRMRDGE